jgi:hypothetical protein
MSKIPALRLAPALLLLLLLLLLVFASSCVTYLSSGQFGHDTLPSPPVDPKADSLSETLVFGRGSYARGLAYPDDNNIFGQAGFLHSWRSFAGTLLVDSHAAASGWYGVASLNEHDSLASTPQYPLSVSERFPYFGGSAQAQSSIALRASSFFMFDLGLRASVAYEEGPYRSFRAEAARLSAASSNLGAVIVDRSPSGWSGTLGGDLALTIALGERRFLRLGYFLGRAFPDLGEALAGAGTGFPDFLEQLSLSVRNERYVISLTGDLIALNEGFGLSLGYLLPD